MSILKLIFSWDKQQFTAFKEVLVVYLILWCEEADISGICRFFPDKATTLAIGILNELVEVCTHFLSSFTFTCNQLSGSPPTMLEWLLISYCAEWKSLAKLTWVGAGLAAMYRNWVKIFHFSFSCCLFRPYSGAFSVLLCSLKKWFTGFHAFSRFSWMQKPKGNTFLLFSPFWLILSNHQLHLFFSRNFIPMDVTYEALLSFWTWRS